MEQNSKKKLTCGFLIYDVNNHSYLGCKPNMAKHKYYDIPKGCQEPGETPLQTALRELEEETGLHVNELSHIIDVGEFPYNKEKNIHLFTATAKIDLDRLYCDSIFEYNGKMIDEMSGYKLGYWPMFYPRLQKLFLENEYKVNISRLLAEKELQQIKSQP